MRMIPNYFYTKEILKQVDNLILDDGYKSYEAICEIEKDSLVLKAMRGIDDMDLFCPITEPYKAEDTISKLQSYLGHGGILEAQDLAETMRRNVHAYFFEAFIMLFEERVNLLDCEIKLEAGLHPVTDRINGEIRWVR